MISALEALQSLREGNRRFASGLRDIHCSSQRRRNEVADRQEPYAVILGCSDSRVPAEIIFDQGLGDLFVIRVAGNVVASSQVGSVEFAVEVFKTPLVVVLGHSACGAVKATLNELERPQGGKRSAMLRSIVDRIRPSVETLVEVSPHSDPETLMHHAVRANIRTSVNQLRHGSPIIEQLVNDGKLLIVGAEYDLKSGFVDFFTGLPEA